MRTAFSLMVASITAFAASFATAQDYWEYEPLEGEYEHHYPTQGIEQEHENEWFSADNDIDSETEQYEWEAGEGYHEQEWYDPSDWFEVGSDIDYEANDDYYRGGYYDDGFYDDDWYYDYYD